MPGRNPEVIPISQPNQYDVRTGVISAPKPPEILAIEKRIGAPLEPIYAKGELVHGRGAAETVDYGKPIGYRYDNGQSQYVNFDLSGKQTSIVDRQNLGTLIKDLAPLALTALGANYLYPLLAGGGAGAGLLGETAALGAGQVSAATPLAFTPEMVAAGTFTPGSIGAAGAASGALTGAELAAAYGAGGGLLTDLAPLTAVPETVTSPIQEVIAETVPQTVSPSINEMIASGTFTPGSAGAAGAASGALTGAELAAAGGLLTQGATPALVDMAAQGAGQVSAATPSISDSFKLPSWATPTNALMASGVLSNIAKANETTPTAPAFNMAPYVPPSGRPYENIAMSPIAAPYTPTQIAGQYDPRMTPGGISPYEMIRSQMGTPVNPYANFEAGTAIGGYNPQLGLLS